MFFLKKYGRELSIMCREFREMIYKNVVEEPFIENIAEKWSNAAAPRQ